MKKLIILIALLNILYAKYYPNALFAHVSGVASNDTLSVRLKPNWRSRKIAELPPNAYVGVDECIKLGHSNWCRVHAVDINLGQDPGYDDTLFGWVNARYLKFSSRGYVAIRGKKECNYAVSCSGGKCRVANVYSDVTMKNNKIVAIKTKSYSRRVLKGIGELDIGASEGYPCNRRGLDVNFYLSKHHTSKISAMSSAENFLKALRSKNLSKIKSYIHPIKGIEITNKLFFSEAGSIHFSRKSFARSYKSNSKLNWGRSYGRGNMVKKGLKSLLAQFTRPIYRISKVKILNRLKGFSGVGNLKGYEFYWQGRGKEAAYNWQGIVVIVQKYHDKWYIVGLLRDRWTI